MKYVTLFLGMIFCITFPITISGQVLPELISEDPIVFDQEANSITAEKEAKLRCEQVLLEAQKITFFRNTLKTEAKGDVRLTRKGSRLVANEAEYTFEEEKFSAREYRFGRPPLLNVQGCTLEGCRDYLYLKKPIVYFGEPDCCSLNLKADSVGVLACDSIAQPDKIRAEKVTFRIGKFPFFYLPSYSHDLNDYPFDFEETHFGQEDRFGLYSRNTVLFNARPQYKVGALLDVYTKRGVLVGPATRYCFDCKQAPSKGRLDAAYIHDQKNREKDVLDRPIQKDRHFVEWQHQQKIGPRLTISNQLRWWKDSEVLRDFRPELFNYDQDPDNFLETVYSGDYYYISLFTRYKANDFQRVQERLPEVNFDLLPIPLFKTPVYQRLNVNFVRLREKDPKGVVQDKESNRFDGFYGLNYPLSFCDILTFSPVLGGRATHYAAYRPGGGDFTRLRGQVGFDAQLNAYGQWNCCNKLWKINGIRHIIHPTLQYRYIPETHYGKGPIPVIEADIFSTNLEPIDLGHLRNRDDGSEIHTFRLGLENHLQTRDQCYGSRTLASLNLYQDIRFSPRKNENTFSDFYTEASLTPVHWLELSLYSRIDPENLSLEELSTSLGLISGKAWCLDFASQYLDGSIDQYALRGQYQLNSELLVKGQWRFDARRHQFVEQIYGLETLVGNSWRVHYGFTVRKGARRENEFKFNILVSLLGFN